MSQILNCGLDQRTLTILAGLIENGVNPEALAAVVKELKRETEALKVINLRAIFNTFDLTIKCLLGGNWTKLMNRYHLVNFRQAHILLTLKIMEKLRFYNNDQLNY